MKVYTVSLYHRLCYNDVGERGVISIMMAKPYKRRKYSVIRLIMNFFAKHRMCNVWGKLELILIKTLII